MTVHSYASRLAGRRVLGNVTGPGTINVYEGFSIVYGLEEPVVVLRLEEDGLLTVKEDPKGIAGTIIPLVGRGLAKNKLLGPIEGTLYSYQLIEWTGKVAGRAIPQNDVERGAQMEFEEHEDTVNPGQAAGIAIDHLQEDPDYYEKTSGFRAQAPADFDRCVDSGGRVRTINPDDDTYLHLCFDDEGSHAGEPHEKKDAGRRMAEPGGTSYSTNLPRTFPEMGESGDVLSAVDQDVQAVAGATPACPSCGDDRTYPVWPPEKENYQCGYCGVVFGADMSIIRHPLDDIRQSHEQQTQAGPEMVGGRYENELSPMAGRRQADSLDSDVWGRELYGPSAVSFSFLSVGDKFTFPGSDSVHTKTSKNGWYLDDRGMKFKTGTGTSVIRALSNRRTAEVCRSCGGTGWELVGVEKCEDCRGRGERNATRVVSAGSPPAAMDQFTVQHLEKWLAGYFNDEDIDGARDAIYQYLGEVDPEAVDRGLSWPDIHSRATMAGRLPRGLAANPEHEWDVFSPWKIDGEALVANAGSHLSRMVSGS